MGAVLKPLLFPHPPREHSASTLQGEPGFVWLRTRSHGKVPALFVDQGSSFVLLYTHGNAEDIGQLVAYLGAMAVTIGVSVFAVEYPGYSISEASSPSENGCYEAVEAAFEHLMVERGMAPQNIIPFGRSLGSGPAVYLASKNPNIQALVLQSPLESGARAVLNKGVGYAGYFIDPFQNYLRIQKVKALTCIMHGTADSVVPCSNGRGLYAALNKNGKAAPPLWLENRGHNDMPHTQVFVHVRDFVGKLTPQTAL
eukprot:TRINITY_DN38809_c0_g1_i1.p1 TRINITY_DN38809_c0_g1~~TRINITY_DN38809_c0_g1_i1.p1  ORF type:complete len:276 (-),score=16.52 TRINITY_DN38809_c0_g1_i1:133-897(-)